MDKRLFYLLNMAQKRVYGGVDRESNKQLGVSVTQLGALMLIRAMPRATQKDIANVLGLKKASASELVDRMVSAGLVEKKRCDKDARAVRLTLSDKGESIATQAEPYLATLNSALTDGFTDAEIAVVLRFLNTLIQRF